MQRRVKRLGVILLVLLGATLLAKVVSVVTGKDAIVESVGPVLAWVAVVLVAGYLVVAIVRAVSRAFLHTNRRPCVHCGLTITTDDEVCPFCDWSQAEVPDDSGLDSGEPSTADGSWPWSET
jgi:hypothetical protein